MIKKLLSIIIVISFNVSSINAQVAYNAAASYGTRKTNPTYTGKAIQVRRTCDNAVSDIGFSSCGDLDVTALQRFVTASNPLNAISSSAVAAYSLRKLNCVSTNSVAINVRRSCDNASQDIGFTANGDFDTTGLQQFVFKASPLSALAATAAAAYSVRRLYCSYAGAAMRVRRSSDNELRDVYFDANGVISLNSLVSAAGGGAATATTLTIWLTTNSGYVNIWYDQSGNNNTATAPATGNQPKIVNAGAITTQNGLPTVVFDGSTSYLQIPYAASMNFVSASTCNAVLARTAAAAGTCDAVFTQQFNSTNISATLAWNSVPATNALAYGYYPPGWQNAYLPTDVVLNTDNIITGTILSGAGNATAINLYQNGTLQTTLTNQTTVGSQSGLGFNIGKRWDVTAAGNNWAPINLQELIVFASVLSTTDRQYLEFSQSAYFTISGPPSLATIPTNAPSAYVTAWYDQTGNGANTTQSVTTNQPRIMNSGVIDRQNGLPSMRYIGTSNMYLAMPQTSVFTLADSYVIGSADVASNANSWWGAYRTAGNMGAANRSLANGKQGVISGFSLWSDWGGYAVDSVFVNQINSVTAFASRANLTSATLSQVTSRQLSPVAASTYASTGISFGGDALSSYAALTGYLNEIIFFSTALSQTDKNYMQWSQAAYYNISGVTVTSIPAIPPSGYITKWYDQSGNGKTLFQATQANQPKIVNAGVVNLQGSLAAIPLDGSSSYMGESTLSISNPYSLNAVATRTGVAGGSSSGYQRLVNISATGDAYGFMGAYTNGGATNYANFTGNGSSWNDLAADLPATSFLLNSQSILTMVVATGATGLVPSINGTALGGKTGTAATATGFLVGAPYSASSTNQLWTGNISELNIFATGLSNTRRNLLETSQSAYYGITTGNSKYTAASGYNLFVTGIGRYNATDSILDSRQSAGMGFISGKTASDFILDNGDYLTAGMSCPQATISLANLPTGATAGYERWANDWYINKTDVNGNGGTIQIFFDFSDYGMSGIPVTASNYQLWGRASTGATFTVVPTTAVTISGDKVLFTLPAANLSTTGYYTIGTIDYQNSPLPIELLNFTAIPNGNKVDLRWETSTETNNKYFTIEKSKDGVTFTKVIDVPGAGNSTSYREYFESDYQPYAGISYYRIKQTDVNGNYKYYPMQTINFTTVKNITVYPNPIDKTSAITIQLNGYKNEEVTVVVVDIQGREFFTKILLSQEDNQLFATDELQSLPPGTYIVTASSNNKIYNYKIIVK